MPHQKNQFPCQYDGCENPATRALTYFVDPPPPYAPSKDAMQDAFCDEHAETEMLQLQTPGFFTVERNGIEVNCTVNILTNCSIADDGDGTNADSVPALKCADTTHACLKSESPDAQKFEKTMTNHRLSYEKGSVTDRLEAARRRGFAITPKILYLESVSVVPEEQIKELHRMFKKWAPLEAPADGESLR